MTVVDFTGLRAATPPPRRLSSSFRAVDLVLGGSGPGGSGFVSGSIVLLSGDPGAGKSTLALQIAAYVGCRGYQAAYVTAEEAATQVQGRAERLGLALAPVQLAATNDLSAALAALDTPEAAPHILIVDSLQTMAGRAGRGAASAQMREGVGLLADFAHRRGAVVVAIGHVTKGGATAGAMGLQHSVDVVLHLEAGRGGVRSLRASKNRFGFCAVVGVLRMEEAGLREEATLVAREGGRRWWAVG